MELILNTEGLKGSIVIGPIKEEEWRGFWVSVQDSGFTAEFPCESRGDGLEVFRDELEAALGELGKERVIEFRTLEHGIALTLKLDKRGHVEGTFEFTRDWRGPVLSGSFAADQTHLASWARALREGLEHDKVMNGNRSSGS
jgi:hypothetical protein